MKLFSGLFAKKEKVDDSIVIVSGLPRSGTSMLMRMLDAGGLPPLTDNERTADDDNPKGYYEFEPVKKLREGDNSWLPRADGKSVKIISALLEYLPKSRNYKVLFMQRAISEVLASQRQMLIRRGEDPNKVSDAEMAQYFEKHLAKVKGWLAEQKNIEVLYLDYNELLRDPTPQVMRIKEFLGNRLDESQMKAMIDPSLYRQRAGK
jgi:LPS sulfotransferase NodH